MKKNIDWKNIKFQYQKTDFRFVARFENGKWSEGELVQDNYIHLHEGSGSLHYGQQCFEGMKAYSAPSGEVLLFRPLENAKRMRRTARRLLMPEVPDDLFLRAVEEAVKANQAWIPPYGSNASLYIRPMLFGSGEMLGLTPAPAYEFRVFVSPVGSYFTSKKLTSIKLYLTTDFDRTSPKGIGAFKAGANYAGGFFIKEKAQEKGASEALFLDSKEQKYLDETGAANIIIYTKDQQLITPLSDTILPSITRRSLLQIAKEKLKIKTQERAIDFYKEVDNFEEFGACGTAAVVAPVSEIITDEKNYTFSEKNPIMQKLYDELTSIQQGEIADEFGWMKVVL
jgi:branched-chain amino acid aminotransferase